MYAQNVNIVDVEGLRSEWHISDEESEEEFDDYESEISSDEDEAAAQKFDAQYTSDVYSDLKNSLAEWKHKYNITHSAMDGLLTLWNTFHPEDNLPRSSRTIVGTPRTVSLTELCENSRYHYFGMKPSLRKILNKNGGKLSKVSMIINVDGLPVYKSSTVQFWTIMCRIKEINSDPFIAALFCGRHKPPLESYLEDFLKEVKELERDGITTDYGTSDFCISSFVCDAPARQFLKKCKGHAGYSSCEKCTANGVSINHSMSFTETNAGLRTDEDFVLMTDSEHHMGTGPSPLTDAGVGMVTMFGLDYLHLVLLGVMKRLLTLWIKKVPYKWHHRTIEEVSSVYISLRKFVPKEFSRKPRTLYELGSFKGTELRMFLLYLGPVALKGVVTNKVYKHFMLLCCGIRILCDSDFTGNEDMLNYAHELLKLFVDSFQSVYRKSNIVYNIHNLIHLTDDVKRHGPLDSWSAFAFENALGKLKRCIKSGNAPAAQACKRAYEQFNYKEPDVRRDNFELSPGNGKDDCVMLNDGTYGLLVETSGEKFIFTRLLHGGNYFTFPCTSSNLGIYTFKGLDSSRRLVGRSQIKRKCVHIKGQTRLLIPYLH